MGGFWTYLRVDPTEFAAREGVEGGEGELLG